MTALQEGSRMAAHAFPEGQEETTESSAVVVHHG
jgi:hypothetical protein